jgi:chorismate synthase
MAILEGIPAGLPLDPSVINQDLARRQKGYGAGARMKIEQDEVQLMGGVMAGETTGAPLAMWIENSDHSRWRAKAIKPFTTPRPGHADLTGSAKYGYTDLRPALERASARETAARVAVGAVCRHLLGQFEIHVGGYVLSIGEVQADTTGIPLQERIENALGSEVGCPQPSAEDTMKIRIRQAMESRDTVGGVIEVVVFGVPIGLGSYVQWDRRLDSRLGAAILSIPAIKGVEIGPAFENTRLPGTKAHDPIRLHGQQVVRQGERSGGLEGGITTGQPLVIRAAMKPIATTLTPQFSVDLASGDEAPATYERSDFCPVPRAVVIIESMAAFVIVDALLEKLGGDSLAELLPRFAALKKATLSDLQMANQDRKWWPE